MHIGNNSPEALFGVGESQSPATVGCSLLLAITEPLIQVGLHFKVSIRKFIIMQLIDKTTPSVPFCCSVI